MKTMNSFYTNEMEVELQLCHLFLWCAFWGLRTSHGNLCTHGSASPKFHHRRMQPILLPVFVYIHTLQVWSCCLFVFYFCTLFVYFMLNIKKIKIKLARTMNIQRIDKPVTIGFILAWNDSLGYSKTPISTSVVCNEITQRVVVYLEKGPTEDWNIDTSNILDS